MVSWQALGLRERDLGAGLPFTYVEPGFLEKPIEELTALRVEHLPATPRTLTLFKAVLGRRVPFGPRGMFGIPVPGDAPGGQFWRVETTLDSPELFEGNAAELLRRFQQETHNHGGLLLFAADLESFWSRTWDGERPSFEDVCSKGAWLAWVQLGDHEAGLRADHEWRKPWRRFLGRRRA